MKQTMKVILVGVGGRGNWAVKLMANNPRFEVVGAVDTNKEILSSQAQILGISGDQCFPDFDAACAATSADFVIICTPMVTHEKLCCAAFRQGLHVLVEKGMATSWEEACNMVAEAEKCGVKFCVSQNYRYKAPYVAIRSILMDPDHPNHPGKIGMVDCMQHRYRPEPRTSNYPYAMVWDMSCHHFDFLISLFGPFESVDARAFSMPWSKYPYPANFTATIRFANGTRLNYMLTHDSRYSSMRWVFQGERGVVLSGDGIDGIVAHDLPERQLRTGQAHNCEIAEQPSDVSQVVDDFCAWIAGGPEPGISGRNNLEIMAACTLVVRSAGEERVVERTELS